MMRGARVTWEPFVAGPRSRLEGPADGTQIWMAILEEHGFWSLVIFFFGSYRRNNFDSEDFELPSFQVKEDHRCARKRETDGNLQD